MADHEGECLTCAQNGKCELQQVAAYLGISKQPFRTDDVMPKAIDSSNPFFNLDRGKCILCARCVRTCAEVSGNGAIGLAYRGFEARVATMSDGLISESTCQSCGECVAHCPTGALTPKESRVPTREVLTVCPYCGVGCEVYLGVRGDKIVNVRGKKDNVSEPRAAGFASRDASASTEFVHSPERLKQPLIRKNGKLEEATWDEALDFIAANFKKYKANEIGVVASAKCTNEDNYVIQKFARAVLGTNNIDHCARLCHASTLAGLSQSFGAGAMTNSIDELEDAKTILAIGTNTTEAHPVIGFEVKRAVGKGAKLIVINPREIDLRFATTWLRERPGTDVALLMGMMRVIVDNGLADTDFIEKRCENFRNFKHSLAEFDIDSVSRITGVAKEPIIEAARIHTVFAPIAEKIPSSRRSPPTRTRRRGRSLTRCAVSRRCPHALFVAPGCCYGPVARGPAGARRRHPEYQGPVSPHRLSGGVGAARHRHQHSAQVAELRASARALSAVGVRRAGRLDRDAARRRPAGRGGDAGDRCERTLELRLDVPANAGCGTQTLTVNAQGQGNKVDLPVAVTLAKELPAKLTVNPSLPALRGTSKSSFEYQLTIKNDSGRNLVVSFAANAPKNFETSFTEAYGTQELSSVAIEAGKSKDVKLKVRPPSTVDAGTYPVSVTVSAEDATAKAEVTLEIVGQPRLIAVRPRRARQRPRRSR